MKNTKRSIAVLVALAATLAGCGSNSESDDSPSGGTDTLNVVTGGAGTYNTPVYLALVKGFAKKQGLKLNITVGNANVLNLVVAGRADLGLNGPSAPLPPAKDGKDTTIVYSVESGPGIYGYVAGTDKVKTIQDCTRVATTAIGTATYATALAFKSVTKSDYTVVPIGDPTTIVPALLSGSSNCALASLGSLVTGLGSGLHLIVDPRKPETLPDNTVQGTAGLVLWGLSPNLKSKRPAVVKLMKALNEATDYMKTATTKQISTDLRGIKELKSYKEEQLASTYEADKPFLSPEGGYIDEASWKANLALFGYSLPYLKSGDEMWNWSKRVDMSYLDAANGKG